MDVINPRFVAQSVFPSVKGILPVILVEMVFVTADGNLRVFDSASDSADGLAELRTGVHPLLEVFASDGHRLVIDSDFINGRAEIAEGDLHSGVISNDDHAATAIHRLAYLHDGSASI